MALSNEVIFCKGDLWIDPSNGVPNLTDYPDNMTGTFAGEASEPLIIMFDPKKIGLVIDRYGDTVLDFRDIGAELTINVKLAQFKDECKELFWGQDRVTASGGIILPGADAANIALSAPQHKILFITEASINGKTTEAAYKMNFFLPRCQPRPADGSQLLLGNEFTTMDIDLIATYQESAASGNQSKRLAQFDTVANITVF